MTEKENKELLLKDLCARLPYGVKIQILSWDDLNMEYINKADLLYSINSDNYIKASTEDRDYYIEDIKPYLFPPSSMTEEQLKLFDGVILPNGHVVASNFGFDYLNSIHVDYRRLIPLGLAIDCTNLNIY